MTRQTGTVAKWLNHRGIGFITPDGQESSIGKDLLVHFSQIQQKADGKDTFKTLNVGSRVEFETSVDPKNADKMIAVSVTGIGGVDCERRTSNPMRRRGPPPSDKPGFVVLVDNLPEDASWRDLKDAFRKCGFVDRADVVKRSDGEPQGTVSFSNEADADKAVDEMHGTELKGMTIQVTRKSAEK